MRRHLMTASTIPLRESHEYLAHCRLAEVQAVVQADKASWPMTIVDAYKAQHLLHERMRAAGHLVVGHKVGCTTPVMQQYLDVPHPCAGGIYNTGLWKAGEDGRVALSSTRYRRLGLECEIAVVLHSALEPGRIGLSEAARAVGSVHCAVEMVDDRYEDFEARKPGVAAWIADDFFHCGSVLGPPLAAVAPERLDGLRGAMWVDGTCVGEGIGADIIAGHPLEALVWLADSPVAHAMGGLPAGWVVSLGSVCRTHWLAPGAGASGSTTATSNSTTTEVRVAFAGDGEQPDADSQGALTLVLGGGDSDS